jgi:hypothetical protein
LQGFITIVQGVKLATLRTGITQAGEAELLRIAESI